MAWPPAALPTNRTNSTPQQDTHPSDHNAIGLAVNDTVGQVQKLSSRRGCQVFANTFAVGPGGSKIIVFDAEYWDPDGFHAPGGSNVVIPTGMDGVYVHAFSLGADAGAQFQGVDVNITIDGVAWSDYLPAGRSSISIATVVPQAAGSVSQCQMWNSDGTNSRNFNARYNVFRVSL
jgi:hypothetical protein